MMEFILHGIFWVLALYGLFELVKDIIYICTYTKLKSDGIYTKDRRIYKNIVI